MKTKAAIALLLAVCAVSCEYDYDNPMEAYGNGMCRPGWAGERCELCVRFVDDDAEPGGGDGLSWATAFTAVQPAIDAAYDATIELAEASRCEVWVAEGTYEVFQGSATDTIYLKPNVDLYGGFAGTEPDRLVRDFETRASVLDGTGDGGSVTRVITLMTHGQLIDGLTIRGGRAAGELINPSQYGAGLTALPGTKILNCRFEDNIAVYGGAIYTMGWGGETDLVEIRNCTFVGNRALGRGGAIYSDGGGLRITNCLFDRNEAEAGGALAGEAAVERSRFTDNEASLYGGALFESKCWGCWLEGNVAEVGGAAYNSMVSLSVMTANTARSTGSAFANGSAMSSTIVGNGSRAVATLFREGEYGAGSPGSLYLFGSIVWGNEGDELHLEATNDGGEIRAQWDLRLNDIEGFELPEVEDGTFTVMDNISQDPLFVDPAVGDFHLKAGSPCIDQVGSGAQLDYDGEVPWDDPNTPNAQGEYPMFGDMGAFEYRP